MGRKWNMLDKFDPGNGGYADVSFTNSTQGLFQLLPAGANLTHTLYRIQKRHNQWILVAFSGQNARVGLFNSPFIPSALSPQSLYTFIGWDPNEISFSSNVQPWLYFLTPSGKFTSVAPISALGTGDYAPLSVIQCSAHSLIVSRIYFPKGSNGSRSLFVASVSTQTGRSRLIWQHRSTASFGDPTIVLTSATTWLYGGVNVKRHPFIAYASDSGKRTVTHAFSAVSLDTLRTYLMDNPNISVVQLFATPGIKHALTTIFSKNAQGTKQYSVTY